MANAVPVGVSAADGAKIVVCHIKSPKSYPELKLERNNLQVLCSEHRRVKGMLGDETDWRKEPRLSVLMGERIEEGPGRASPLGS